MQTNLSPSRVGRMMAGTKRRLSAKELERIHDEHRTVMFRLGMALLREESSVRDVLQDLFLKLAQGARLPADPDQERAYVLRMVRHAAIDRMRRNRVRREHAASAPRDELFASGPDPDREAFRRRLEQALGSLPAAQREVVVLKLWEQLTFDEIGRVCGIPANTAASRYRYGIDKLQGVLRPLYEEL